MVLWTPNKPRVNKKNCTCSCFDTIFRGELEISFIEPFKAKDCLTLLHSERPKLHTILAFLSAKG